MAKPPYLGVAYYPEDWPEEQMDSDIRRMREIGVNVARIGEFAWHRMEPHPGEFDFSYFHPIYSFSRQMNPSCSFNISLTIVISIPVSFFIFRMLYLNVFGWINNLSAVF